MSGTVRMRHEGVEGEIEVAACAVPHHQAAGWLVVDAPSAAPSGPALVEPEPSAGSAPKRRRATKEESE